MGLLEFKFNWFYDKNFNLKMSENQRIIVKRGDTMKTSVIVNNVGDNHPKYKRPIQKFSIEFCDEPLFKNSYSNNNYSNNNYINFLLEFEVVRVQTKLNNWHGDKKWEIYDKIMFTPLLKSKFSKLKVSIIRGESIITKILEIKSDASYVCIELEGKPMFSDSVMDYNLIGTLTDDQFITRSYKKETSSVDGVDYSYEVFPQENYTLNLEFF